MTTTEAETPLSRRSLLKAGGVLALGGIGLTGRSQAQTVGIPANPVTYQIQMAGQTSHGPFNRTGFIYVSPSVEMTPSNPRDIALLSGNPKGAPEIGAIEFYTNTYLRTVLNTGGNRAMNDGRIKVGSVQMDESRGALRVQPIYNQGVDFGGGVNPGLQVNVFTPQAGIIAPLYELNGGYLDIQFQGGNQISGVMELTGISLSGAQNQAWLAAEFTGRALS